MGDHRLNVEISVVGTDGEEHEIDMWLNWTETRPEEVYKAMIDLANKAQLQVEDKSYLFDD